MSRNRESIPRFLADSVLPPVSLIAMTAALFMVFIYVPTDEFQGIVQRIFYFHVPAAIVTFVAIGVVALGSIMFLWRGSEAWDRLAHSAAEVGLTFCTIVLTTGPIWARPIWGTWWTWDARLTTTLILWLIYVAYLMLRAFAPSRELGARYAAVLGVVGAIDVPIINRSVYWWRTIHPAVLQMRGGGTGLTDPRMQLTLLVCFIAFFLVATWLLWVRYETGRLNDDLAALQQQAMAGAEA